MVNSPSRTSLWRATAPNHPELPVLSGNHRSDVAIIGGGYTGLSAALHLADSGIDAVLVEAQTVGYGGAGRNVGLVNAGLWLMPDDVVKIMGSDDGERLIEILGASPDLVFELIDRNNISCEAVRKGTLHCAHAPAGFKALQQRESQWRKRGAPVTLLDQDEAAPMIGSRAFYGALLDQRAGSIQPLAYAFGLAEAAKSKGARLFIDSPVTSMDRFGDYWRVNTPQGCVTSTSVILAVQGYADYAFQDRQRALVPFNFFQFSTPPLPDSVRNTILPGKQAAWDTALVLSSYRLDEAGRLIIGSVGQVGRGAFGLHQQWAMRTIKKVFPQAGPVDLEYGWDGTIAMTTNHIPRFHLLGKNFVTVTSYNGRGIGPGTVFGKLLAEYVQNGNEKSMPLPLSRPNPIFLRNLRGLFYETGARLYHLVHRRGRSGC